MIVNSWFQNAYVSVLELCRTCDGIVKLQGSSTLVSLQIVDLMPRRRAKGTWSDNGSYICVRCFSVDMLTGRLEVASIARCRLQVEATHANDVALLPGGLSEGKTKGVVHVVCFVPVNDVFGYQYHARGVSDCSFVLDEIRGNCIGREVHVPRALESKCWRPEEGSSSHNGDAMKIVQSGQADALDRGKS